MDNKDILLQTIEKMLRSYADWVRDGKGIHSKTAEDFYRELLNLALGYALGNMNRIRDNFPAIDLGNDMGLAVQVTSTGTAVKVKETLERFYRHGLNKDYNRLIVLVAGSAECRSSSFDHPGVELKIWGTPELVEELRELPQEKLEEVAAFLERRVYRAEVRVPLLELPIGETMGADGFVGREAELEKLAQTVGSVKPLVLSGLGGMGKTELARRFGSTYSAGRVFFAQFRGSFYDTVADSVAFGIPGMEEQRLDAAQRYTLAMEQLRLCGEQDLLIIDNADGGARFADLKDETYEALCGLPLRLLLTTRHEVPGAIEVTRLANDELHRIFENHRVCARREELEELIRAVDGHTMTVDLMARTMVGGWKPVTPRMLLDALQKQSLKGQPYEPVGTDYNREKRQDRIYDHLRIVFNVAGIPQEAKDALRCAVLLPEGGMEPELFGNALPEEARSALNGLLTHGWLQRKEGLVTIHPVVRLVCRTELEPTEENCEDFLLGIHNQYDPKQYDHVKFRQMAELFENASTTLEDKTGFWANQAGYLWGEVAETQRALSCDLRSVEKMEQHQPDSNNLATGYNNVGSTYGDLGEHQKALEYLLKALAIRERVLPEDHPDLALSYNNVGSTYGALGEHQKALEYQQKALAIRERVLPEDHPDLAQSYNNVGSAYGDLGDHQKALEYKQKALAIWERVLPPDHPDMAISYGNVGSTYRAMGEPQKALEYELKVISIFEKVLPQDHPHLATSYNNVGNTYGYLGEHQKALEYQLKALAIRERVLPEDHPDLALSYANLSCTFGELGDHEKELEYDLKALAIRERILPEDHPDLAGSYNNVGCTYGDLGDHQKALEYKLKAQAIRERVLPEDHPDLALSYNNVGGTYYAQGNYERALEYQQKALEIWERVLPENHPDLALSYFNVALDYQLLNKLTEAAAHMRRAADIINRSTLPEGHPKRVNYNKWAEELEREARKPKRRGWLARLFGK